MNFIRSKRISMKRVSRMCRRAFTLVELLAVIAIIGALAVVVTFTFDGGNESYALGNAQRIAASVFQSARSIAVLKNTETRVIIYRGGSTGGRNDSNKQLRYMGVIFKNKQTDEWQPANSGTYLPDGVYFVPPNPGGAGNAFGFVAGTSGELKESAITYVGDSSDNRFDYSVSFPSVDGDLDSWFFYEFDNRGLSLNPGALFVVAAGERVAPSGGNVAHSITFENQYAVAGFAVRKMGGVTLFTDYEDIE